MNKIAILFLFVTLFICYTDGFIEINAYDYLPYWYSDSSKISSFDSEEVYFYYNNYGGYCDMAESDIFDYVDEGLDTWDDLFSVDFTYSGSGTDRFSAGCISRDDASSLGIPGGVVGFASTGTRTYDYRARKPSGSIVTFYTHTGSGAYLYMIWDDEGSGSNVKTSDFSDEEWETISRHETGHLIGFIGHNPSVDQLMYYNMSTFYNTYGITTPQDDDIDQMKLVYGYGD